MKTLLEGAAQIRKVRSAGESSWTNWNVSDFPHIRWSRTADGDYDFQVMAFSKLPNYQTPEIHWGTSGNSTQFDKYLAEPINLVVTEASGGYEMTFSCRYKQTASLPNGMDGAMEGVGERGQQLYVEGEKKDPAETTKPHYTVTVVQHVRFGENTYDTQNIRRFYFNHIINLYGFHSSNYNIQPDGGSTVDIVFDHTIQKNEGHYTPVPSGFQLTQENIIVTKTSTGSGTVDYLNISAPQYQGGLSATIHVAVKDGQQFTDSASFQFKA